MVLNQKFKKKLRSMVSRSRMLMKKMNWKMRRLSIINRLSRFINRWGRIVLGSRLLLKIWMRML
jgi:hypothetical protein